MLENQGTDAQFIHEYFSAQVAILLDRCQRSPQLSYHELFSDIDDDLFFILAKGLFANPSLLRQRIPDWPSEEVRVGSTSSLPFHLNLLEAHIFWQSIKRAFSLNANRPIRSCRVADYGAGWGRIARLAARDIPEGKFVAFEPNPQFVDLYRSSRVPGILVPTDFRSEQVLDHGVFDIVYCFSILTHASAALTSRICERWKELTAPGSLIFTTVRPSYFLQGGQGDAALLPSPDQSRKLFDSGEIVFVPYRDSQDWGVTVMSPAYLERVFGSDFIVGPYHPNPLTQNQLIVELRRK